MIHESPRHLTLQEGLHLVKLHLRGELDQIEADIRRHGGTDLNAVSNLVFADIQAIERIQRRVFGEVGER